MADVQSLHQDTRVLCLLQTSPLLTRFVGTIHAPEKMGMAFRKGRLKSLKWLLSPFLPQSAQAVWYKLLHCCSSAWSAGSCAAVGNSPLPAMLCKDSLSPFTGHHSRARFGFQKAVQGWPCFAGHHCGSAGIMGWLGKGR